MCLKKNFEPNEQASKQVNEQMNERTNKWFVYKSNNQKVSKFIKTKI